MTLNNNTNNFDDYDHEYMWKDLQKKTKIGTIYQKYFLFPILSKHIDGKLVDIGAGLGDFCIYYKNSVAADINRIAFDNYKKKNIEAKLLVNNKLDVSDFSFDTALLDNVIEHIYNPVPLLLEIKRILKNKGKLVVGVPGIKGFDNDEDHKVFYDEKSLTILMKKFGFKVKNIFYTPFKSKYLDNNLKAYCLYMVFEVTK